MKKYKIVRTTNPYIAQRCYSGITEETLWEGLTLPEAKEELLMLYNSKYDGERPYALNWGLAVIQSRRHVAGAFPTLPDGTRCFDWDSRLYSIIIMED